MTHLTVCQPLAQSPGHPNNIKHNSHPTLSLYDGTGQGAFNNAIDSMIEAAMTKLLLSGSKGQRIDTVKSYLPYSSSLQVQPFEPVILQQLA